MKRIFAVISRDMTEKTAVCVFPWELPILAHIHGEDVREASIDEMASIKGALKVEKLKLPHAGKPDMNPERAPGLRAQLEAMVTVAPEDNPANDPATEYGRLVGVYGMDKEVKASVVERIYGLFQTGHFSSVLEPYRDDVQDLATVPPLTKAPSEMSVAELRDALKARSVPFEATATKRELIELLDAEVTV